MHWGYERRGRGRGFLVCMRKVSGEHLWHARDIYSSRAVHCSISYFYLSLHEKDILNQRAVHLTTLISTKWDYPWGNWKVRSTILLIRAVQGIGIVKYYQQLQMGLLDFWDEWIWRHLSSYFRCPWLCRLVKDWMEQKVCSYSSLSFLFLLTKQSTDRSESWGNNSSHLLNFPFPFWYQERSPVPKSHSLFFAALNLSQCYVPCQYHPLQPNVETGRTQSYLERCYPTRKRIKNRVRGCLSI